MRLLWIEKPLVVGEPLLLDEVHVRHLRDVLRMRVGAKLQARSPYLPYHLAEIVVTRIEKRSLEVEVLQIQAIMPPAVEITLVQSYPKASKFDDILRMAIEAGVSAVRPVISEHSDFKERGQKPSVGDELPARLLSTGQLSIQ